MRQLVLTGPGQLRWDDVDDPRVEGSGEAVVRPLVVATCDLDAPMIRGMTPFPLPVALGHECVAEVVEAGPGVTVAAPGDRVVVPFQISCGACVPCRRGHTGNCETVPRLSMFGFGAFGQGWGGMLADRIRVPFADAMLVRVPAGVAPEHVASASDNIADGYRAVAPHLASEPGAPVLVAGGGTGSVGLYAAGAAVALGASRVDYADADPDRLARAERLGANPIEVPRDYADLGVPRAAYPIAVDASNHPQGLTNVLRATAPEGVCTSISVFFEPVALPLLEMYTQTVTFKTGRAHARPQIPGILDLVAAGRLHPEVVTTQTVTADEAPEALAAHRAKTLVTMA